jgi:hypothetical protein
MKKLLFGLAALPFLAGVALAAEPISDAQMDQVTAGDPPPPTCTGNCSTSTRGFVIPPNITPKNDFNALVQSYFVFLNGQGYTPAPSP